MKRKRYTQVQIPKRLQDGLWLSLAAVLLLAACGGSSHTLAIESTKVPAVVDAGETSNSHEGVTVGETVYGEKEVQVTRVVEAESAVQMFALGEPAPADMFFEEYGTNPFIDTEDDFLSTFAIDVDTGAYSVMRRYINDGLLPPDEAVRVEEFINYFEQDYERPDRGAFAIHLEGVLGTLW